MEARLRECESEVTKMAKVSLTKTKLPQSAVPLPIQRSCVSSQKSCTFSFLSLSLFYFYFFLLFPPTSSFISTKTHVKEKHAQGSGWWMQQ